MRNDGAYFPSPGKGEGKYAMLRKLTMGTALALALLLILPARADALEATELIPVGEAVGIELMTDGVMVVGLSEVETSGGPVRPAADAGLKAGDVIKRIGDRDTPCAADFLAAVSGLRDGAVRVTAVRGGREVAFDVTPAKNTEGNYQLGLWLRDGVSGIGTVTFYDPDSGTFGALGHGINDVDTGALLPFDGGSITGATVVDVIRGNPGTPGELCGRFDRETILGALEKNTESGIFGKISAGVRGEPLPVAAEDEVTLGPATILTNVSGDQVEEFSVEISRVYREAGDNRFLLLTVTDKALLERTGGIVQGMSGSPILQNGKLVGAVTHVLISDPTRGYGISIENMLKAA